MNLYQHNGYKATIIVRAVSLAEARCLIRSTLDALGLFGEELDIERVSMSRSVVIVQKH